VIQGSSAFSPLLVSLLRGHFEEGSETNLAMRILDANGGILTLHCALFRRQDAG
jgi:hypothetical protein